MRKSEERGLLVRHRSERASYHCANFSGYEGEFFWVVLCIRLGQKSTMPELGSG
jgi:hypothetical protein